jgi:hypothetical protein
VRARADADPSERNIMMITHIAAVNRLRGTAAQVDCSIVIKRNQRKGNWNVLVNDGKGDVKSPNQIKVV